MNRNPVKQWSITFPQTETEREAFVKTFPPVDEAICSREEHQDGGYHLHLSLKLKKPISKSKLLKWIESKWPNDYKRIDVQPTRSIQCWADYISKEDPDKFVIKEDASEKEKRLEKVLGNIVSKEELAKMHRQRKEMNKAEHHELLVQAYQESPEFKEAIKAYKQTRRLQKENTAYYEYCKQLGY